MIFGQKISISGSVVGSDDGQPIVGASIVVKGHPIGTTSDENGSFFIDLPNYGSIIQVSFLGMKSVEITVNNNSPIFVKLDPDLVIMEEAVVTALGIKRSEKALGYSAQKVSNEKLQVVKSVDMAASLTGKVSGLMVKNSSDFASAPTVTLRGETPLIVIDGVPYSNMTLRDVANDDIESLSFLKGATASALYGYRGSSGVIMINTKNGKGESDGISVNLSTNTMFAAGFVAIPKVQGIYGRGTTNAYNKNSDESWGRVMDGSMQLQWDPIKKEDRIYEYRPVGVDNFKNFLENSYITSNNLSIAYNSKNASLRSSIDWTGTKGLYPNSMYDKYGFTLGGEFRVKKLTFSSNAAYHKQTSPNIGFNGYTSYDPMYTLLIWTAPDYNILDYKDNYWMIPNVKQNFTYKSTHNNPYFDRNEKVKIVDRDIFNIAANVNYDFTKWLKLTVRSGLDFYLDREDLKVSKDSYVSTGNTSAAGAGYWSGQWTGLYATGRRTGYSMNNDMILSGDYTWGDFSLEGLVGGTIFFSRDETIGASTKGGISIPGYFSLKASVEAPTVSSSVYKQQVNSVYGRLMFAWKKMLFVEGTLRNDWSSTLPKDNSSYMYPSVSGSFVISELLKNTSHWLDLWKVRSSWTVSKTPPGIYETNTTFSVQNPSWANFASATMSRSLPPIGILPQSANTFEVGTQGMFFKNRLMLDVSYYSKLMYDFLKTGPISIASGYVGTFVNTDEEITRKGWEVTLKGTPVLTSEWQLDLDLNWSKYARYYTALDEKYSLDRTWVKVGNRVDAYVLQDYALDPQGNHIFSNGRVQFNPYYSVYGYSDPDWMWGLNGSLRYKSFTFSFSVDGRVGGLTNSLTESYLWVAGAHPKSVTAARAADVANPGSTNFIGEGVKVVSGTVAYDAYGNVLSDNRVYAKNDVATTFNRYAKDMHAGVAWGGAGRPADTFSTTFIKLRELALSYSLPKPVIKNWAKSVSVGVTAQNMFMWAKDFKYSDPDGGSDNFTDPSVRYLGFNVKFSF